MACCIGRRLSFVCVINSSVAEDVCVSIPNGIMCGPIVPNPGVAIRPSVPPSQLPASDERSDLRPDSRSHDQRRETRPENQREGHRSEPNYGRRLYRSYRPSYVRGPLHEIIDERRYTRRGKRRSLELEGMVGGRDRQHHRFQLQDERRFENRRDIEHRGRRGERQVDDWYRYGHRTYERRVERPVPRDNTRYYNRRWD